MINRGATDGVAQAMVDMLTAKNEGDGSCPPQNDDATHAHHIPAMGRIAHQTIDQCLKTAQAQFVMSCSEPCRPNR